MTLMPNAVEEVIERPLIDSETKRRKNVETKDERRKREKGERKELMIEVKTKDFKEAIELRNRIIWRLDTFVDTQVAIEKIDSSKNGKSTYDTKVQLIEIMNDYLEGYLNLLKDNK